MRLEYRNDIEKGLLGEAIRSASLLFIALQTVVFIPADWILHPQHFSSFLVARLVENALLLHVYFVWSYRNAVHATAFTAFSGSTLFLYMVHETGGVESGYYVGLMLLLVGIAVLAPLSGRQSTFISAVICGSYASLPWTSHGGAGVNWAEYTQHVFFLGSASIESALACFVIDRIRFNDFKQKRELIEARDALAEMDQAKSRFSANVHHELRTPLTLILSPLDAIRAGDFGELPTHLSQILDTMHANGRRLHSMINDLLDLAKLESQAFAIVRRPTNFDALIGELVRGAMPMAKRKGVLLSHRAECGDQTIAVDRQAIEKVAVNLLGNALKFTERGGSIIATTKRIDSGVEFEVADSGIGIPPEKLNSIFNRFAQVDTSSTRTYEGTGIGLSLAQEMVELHGGRIWATSDGLGRGTEAGFWLPSVGADDTPNEVVLRDDDGRHLSAEASLDALASEIDLRLHDDHPRGCPSYATVFPQAEADDSATQKPADVEDSDFRAEILIVEDNPDMRQLLAALVSRTFDVRLARNGREAISEIEARKPDLVLSDVMMPEVDGIELCGRIKNDPLTRAIPVVLVTSKAESEMKIEGLEIGADDYVTKPFHPRELLARIGSLVRANLLREELAAKNEQLTSALSELQRTEVRLVQKERLAAIGELAAGIAHEVNNPVNFALNAARLLSRNTNSIQESVARANQPHPTLAHSQNFQNVDDLEPLSRDAVELCEIVVEGLRRTSSLVGDLKRFASPGEGSSRVLRRVSIDLCVRSSIALAEPTLAAANVRTAVETGNSNYDVDCDEGAVGQVFLNVLNNACDAMRPNGGTIRIQVLRGSRTVEVAVTDTGSGVPVDLQPKIFEPFFTTKAAGDGTGLGLSISRGIMQEHNGSIDISSAIDKGTTVRMIFNAAQIE